MRLIRIISTLLLLAMGTISHGQSYFVTNQYVYDLYLVNPAAASQHTDCFSVNGYFLKQWLNTDLAPTSQVVSFQKALVNRLGLGTYVYHDRNGNHGDIGFQQSAAYKITVHKSRRRITDVLFGMSLLVNQRSLDMNNFFGGTIDPVIERSKQNGYGFNANSGVMVTVNQWYGGLSLTNMFPFTNSLYSRDDEPSIPMDINFQVGSAFKLRDRDLYLEPLIYYRFNSRHDSRTDVNLKATMPTLDPSFAWWGVASYRRTMDQSWGSNLGVATALGIIKNNISVGVEYQFGLTRAQADFGSYYQFVAGYKFCRNRKYEAIPCSKNTDVMKVGL